MSSIQIIVAKRKSIGISVNPDCTVKVRIPKNTPQSKIDEVIKKYEKWISKKIEYFSKNIVTNNKDNTFYYLGDKYEIEIIESNKNYVNIIDKKVAIYKKSTSDVTNILKKWFYEQATILFTERFKINFAIFSQTLKYPVPILKLRRIKSRWGSMSSRGIMTLNIRLLHTSVACIDYVIMHELCHLKHKNHSKNFYKLQSFFIPNYKDLKKELNKYSIINILELD